jgi:rSAM/selenodomain-associated transferase 2
MISVVIPTLNEEAELPATLDHLRRVPTVSQVIVSDAGSTDATRRIADLAGAEVVEGGRGRGGQLGRGVALAREEVVAFLHADTWVASDFGPAILEVVRRPRHVGGACLKTFRDPHWLMYGSKFRCRLRFYLWRFAYGDQALFFSRTELNRMGGVPAVPLMEEYLLCRSAKAVGLMGLAKTTVTTSARRFREHGVVQTYWRMAVINARWNLGASPEALRRYYDGP